MKSLQKTILLAARRLLPVLLSFSLLVFSARPDTALADQTQEMGLVFIRLQTEQDWYKLAALDLAVVHYQYDSQGQPYALSLAQANDLSQLSRQGLQAQVLDASTRGANYYMILAQGSASLEAASRRVPVLFQDGREALVRATPQQAEQLSILGFEIARVGDTPLVLPVGLAPSHLPQSIEPDPYIAAIMSRVGEVGLYTTMQRLTGIRPAPVTPLPYTLQTRHTNSGVSIQKATQYIYEFFQAQGLITTYKPWALSGYSGQNVEGVLPGHGPQPCLYLITAHLDNMPSGSTAPGADDNASGVAAVMAVAQLFSQYQWNCTLRFVAFTGEEQGLLGSKIYAMNAYNAGESIQGVLNLDMIAYDSDPFPILDLHARTNIPGSEAIADLFIQVVSAYSVPLTPHKFLTASLGNQSDNKSFWDYGYAAILGIEDYDNFTPYYHTTGDTLSTLNMTYFTNFVKASLGTFAHMAGLIDPVGTLSGQVNDAQDGLPLQGAAIEARLSPTQAWAAVSDDQGGFQLALPAGVYTLTASLSGYQPFSVGGAGITAYQDHTQNFSLAPYQALGPLSLSFEPLSPQAGEEVTFTAVITSGSLPITITWDFGDGTPALSGEAVDQVSHTFPLSLESETYTVTVTAENPVSNRSAEVAVQVAPLVLPEPLGPLSITFEPLKPTVGELVTFTAVITSGALPITYTWDFGDGSPLQTGPGLDEIQHAFPLSFEPETYTVSLSAENIISAQFAQVALQVLPLDPPLQPLGPISIVYEPLMITAGDLITFTAVLTSGSLPITYTWDFGDGSPIQTGPGLQQIQHAFPLSFASETYTVSVTAANPVSTQQAEVLLQVLALEQPLGLLSLSFEPLEPAAGEPVTFTAVITSGALPVLYEWDFGDGSALESGINLYQTAHTFQNEGSFTVAVTALNSVSSQHAHILVVIRAAQVTRPIYLPLLWHSPASRLR
jgi:PKD repeat protein